MKPFLKMNHPDTRHGIEVSLNIQSGCGDPGNPNIAHDNGLKKIVSAETTVSGPGKIEMKLPMPPANEIFYQDFAVQAVRKTPGKTGDDAIRNWSVKTYNKNDFNPKNYSDEFPGDGADQAIDPDQTVDLTDRFKDGVLRWDVPAGDWTVIRYGMTSTGKRNNYANGKTHRIDHPAAIAPVTIQGPWKVDFVERPQLGKTFSATYDTLRSWTDSADRVEKYFSGTVRYTRSFTLDPAATAADRRACLDLGFVGDVATVRLNGQDIGVLWKAPYTAAITRFLKPGENVLEVEVTNQWVNRLVGDLKLPPGERKTYTNVLDGPPNPRQDPRSPQRLGEPDADKYLRVSGLLGPVEIRFSGTHPLNPRPAMNRSCGGDCNHRESPEMERANRQQHADKTTKQEPTSQNRETEASSQDPRPPRKRNEN